jgi:peroxiredoxin
MELIASEWLNSAEPLRLADLRGRVVLLLAFQMHCAGCVIQAVPQAQRVHQLFKPVDVVVLGLHSVFENHAAASPAALREFIQQHGLTFPIAVDQASDDHPVPWTMRALRLDGTPTVVLFDRNGRLRLRRMGHLEDLRLGAMIGQLLSEPAAGSQPARGTA